MFRCKQRSSLLHHTDQQTNEDKCPGVMKPFSNICSQHERTGFLRKPKGKRMQGRTIEGEKREKRKTNRMGFFFSFLFSLHIQGDNGARVFGVNCEFLQGQPVTSDDRMSRPMTSRCSLCLSLPSANCLGNDFGPRLETEGKRSEATLDLDIQTLLSRKAALKDSLIGILPKVLGRTSHHPISSSP